jgi:hypothetical protein
MRVATFLPDKILGFDTIAVSYFKMEKPSLHIAIECGEQRGRCDCCSLQGNCGESFDNGKTCKLIVRNHRWVRIKPEQIEKIVDLNS